MKIICVRGAGGGGGWGKGGGGADKMILRVVINLTPSDRMTLKVQGPLKDRQK